MNIFKSKTILFNILYGIIGVAGVFGYAQYEPDETTANLVEQIVIGVGAIINIVLRIITTKPISQKDSLLD